MTTGRVIVTDKLASYQLAHRALLPSVTHRRSKYLNNRAENSHQPTRVRERVMKRFASPGQAQRLLFAASDSTFGGTYRRPLSSLRKTAWPPPRCGATAPRRPQHVEQRCADQRFCTNAVACGIAESNVVELRGPQSAQGRLVD